MKQFRARYKIAFTLFTVIFLSLNLYAQTTAIKAGFLFDPETGIFVKQKIIYVENGRIKSISDFRSDVKADHIIDLSDRWVMPGLMDLHVHLEGESSPSSYLEEFTKNTADRAYDAAVYAKRTLLAGFTTVRDLGGSG